MATSELTTKFTKLRNNVSFLVLQGPLSSGENPLSAGAELREEDWDEFLY